MRNPDPETQPTPPLPNGARSGGAWLGVVVASAASAAYLNSFHGPFIFDDVSAIAENPVLDDWRKALSPAQGGLTTSGRPLLSLSFALNRALGGSAVVGYHAINLLIHALAALMLYGIVRRTLQLPRCRKCFGPSSDPLALVIAVLWAVHPLQTEAVTYLVQRAESLVGLCYLAALYGFIRSVDAPGKAWRWGAFSIGVCFAGMAAKEVMVTAPLMILFFDRALVAGNFADAWRKRWKLHLGLMSAWLWLGMLLVAAGTRGGTMALGVGATWWAYPLTQFRAVVQYLGLALWPNPLVLDYGTRWIAHFSDILPDALIIVPLVVLAFWAAWRRPAPGFLGVWFFGILAPTSFAPGTIQMTVEHRMYLPLAAVITGGALVLQRAIGRRSTWFFWPLAAAALLLTVHRNSDYRSALGIWTDTVAKRPANALARNNLGRILHDAGRTSEAISHYEAALRSEPNSPESHNNLGVALRDSGQIAGALTELEQAVRLRPDYAEAQNNLGVALRQAGSFPEAIAHHQEALRLRPGFAEAHNNLGSALQNTGHPIEARAEFERALQLAPDLVEAHSNLAVALRQTGDLKNAASQFESALRLRPDYAEVHFNLALLLLELGRGREAKEHYEAARRLKPDVPEISMENFLAR